MQFMNSSLDKIFKNLPDSDFKYLADEIGSKNLELLNQNLLILMSTWTVLKSLMKRNLKSPFKKCFYRSLKNEKTGDNGEN